MRNVNPTILRLEQMNKLDCGRFLIPYREGERAVANGDSVLRFVPGLGHQYSGIVWGYAAPYYKRISVGQVRNFWCPPRKLGTFQVTSIRFVALADITLSDYGWDKTEEFTHFWTPWLRPGKVKGWDEDHFCCPWLDEPAWSIEFCEVAV